MVFLSSAVRQPGRPHAEVQDKLLYSDIDDTYLTRTPEPDAYQRTADTLADNPDVMVGLSTARRLQDVKILLDDLKEVPISFLGVSNGRELYVNHQQRPTEEWLMSLTQADEDQSWKSEVKAKLGHWDALAEVPEALTELGFLQIPNPKEGDRRIFYQLEDAVVSIFPGHTGFTLKGGPPELAPKLAAAIQDSMAAQDIPTRASVNVGDQGHQTYAIVPEALSKATLLEHCLQRYPGVKYVVTAGDAAIDDHLFPDEVGGRQNYRIVAGSRPELAARMEGVERVVRVQSGDIGPGLRQHLETIENLA